MESPQSDDATLTTVTVALVLLVAVVSSVGYQIYRSSSLAALREQQSREEADDVRAILVEEQRRIAEIAEAEQAGSH